MFNTFSPENHAVCGIMWKKYGRTRHVVDDKIGCMRFAY